MLSLKNEGRLVRWSCNQCTFLTYCSAFFRQHSFCAHFNRTIRVRPNWRWTAVTPANTLFCNININVWPGEQLTSTEGCRWTCSVLRSWHCLGIFSLFLSNNTYLTPIYSMFSLDGLQYFFLSTLVLVCWTLNFGAMTSCGHSQV